MSNNKKYIVLPGGKECKPKSPHYCESISTYRCYELPDCPLCKGCIADIEFDKTAPTYKITEVMPEGETFEGSEVWQFFYKYEGWRVIESKLSYDTPLQRIAIKPLKAKYPVKEETICKDGYDKLTDADKKLYTPPNVIEERVDLGEVWQMAKKYATSQQDAITDNFNDLAVGWGDGYIQGANWQQSQSIEAKELELHLKDIHIQNLEIRLEASIDGIVGFVLEWVANHMEHVTKEYANHILKFQSDIIKEYNNGK